MKKPLEQQNFPLKQLLDNLNLSRDGILNITGALLFGKNTALRLPAFIIKAVTYPGTDIDEDEYIDSQDISGTLKNIFDDTLGFILINIRREQKGQGVNSLGKLEVPKIVFEELVTNALIHRDYFVSAPVRIFCFQ
jgi:ATP-dependent DNA helicase RecG